MATLFCVASFIQNITMTASHRARLGQQCQYGSRYIEGRHGCENLGQGLRFNNGNINGRAIELDSRDFHAVRIHRDDCDEFERRYKRSKN